MCVETRVTTIEFLFDDTIDELFSSQVSGSCIDSMPI